MGHLSLGEIHPIVKGLHKDHHSAKPPQSPSVWWGCKRNGHIQGGRGELHSCARERGCSLCLIKPISRRPLENRLSCLICIGAEAAIPGYRWRRWLGQLQRDCGLLPDCAVCRFCLIQNPILTPSLLPWASCQCIVPSCCLSSDTLSVSSLGQGLPFHYVFVQCLAQWDPNA